MIAYEFKTEIVVKLDGKTIGRIKVDSTGWAYYPQNKKKYKGDSFPTFQECKKSIEGQ